tara:strand:- start:880 stop:1011 length:132 start_codon:yes stop_codon:yes gene_type:complete
MRLFTRSNEREREGESAHAMSKRVFAGTLQMMIVRRCVFECSE